VSVTAGPAAGDVDADLRRRYAVGGIVPSRLARPTDVAELAVLVAEANATGAALVPIGRGAHVGLGHAPRRYDLAVVTDALSRVHDYTPADMTVTVECGVTLAELADVLEREGQWLPIDPALPESTTVGGLLAADLAGPLAAVHGRARDYVIGIAVVTAAGVVARAGGRVVKNVAGYDLMKLFIGSLGTLAVVTEATFKVRPRPERDEHVVFRCPTLAAGIAFGAAVDAAHLGVLALTVDGLLDAAAQVVVRLGGVAADVAVARDRLLRVGTSHGAALDLAGDDALPVARVQRDFVRTADGDLVLRLATLPSRLAALAAVIPSALAGATANVAAHCDPLRGVLTLAVTTDDAEAVLQRCDELVPAHGAHVVVERWPAACAAHVDVWRPLPPAFPLMRRMKDALDPRGTLAPGRFVGRL
jgi:glycolate oxidase FAD binding subunit